LSGTLFLRSHVRLHLDAGALERVVVSGITMKDVGAPLFVRLGDRARPFVEGQPRPPVGTLRGVQISNIQGTATQKTGCAIAGLPGHPVEDVWLENIRLQFPGGGADTDARRVPPEEADKYPEYKMFGTLPAFGMYCRHVRGLRTQGLALSTAKPDARPAVAYEDVTKGD
jgi:polygalacturonase